MTTIIPALWLQSRLVFDVKRSRFRFRLEIFHRRLISRMPRPEQLGCARNIPPISFSPRLRCRLAFDDANTFLNRFDLMKSQTPIAAFRFDVYRSGETIASKRPRFILISLIAHTLTSRLALKTIKMRESKRRQHISDAKWKHLVFPFFYFGLKYCVCCVSYDILAMMRSHQLSAQNWTFKTILTPTNTLQYRTETAKQAIDWHPYPNGIIQFFLLLFFGKWNRTK